jgi:hypothetical protein
MGKEGIVGVVKETGAQQFGQKGPIKAGTEMSLKGYGNGTTDTEKGTPLGYRAHHGYAQAQNNMEQIAGGTFQSHNQSPQQPSGQMFTSGSSYQKEEKRGFAQPQPLRNGDNPYLYYNPMPNLGEDVAAQSPKNQHGYAGQHGGRPPINPEMQNYKAYSSATKPSAPNQGGGPSPVLYQKTPSAKVPGNFRTNLDDEEGMIVRASETNEGNFPRSNAPRRPPNLPTPPPRKPLSNDQGAFMSTNGTADPRAQMPMPQGRKVTGTKFNSATRDKDILINSSQNIIGSGRIGSGASYEENKSYRTAEPFRPYTLKEYKDLVQTNTYAYGGLGPNILTDDWQKKKEQRDRMQIFADQLKARNAEKFLQQLENETTVNTAQAQIRRNQPSKEQSKRERALEFARTIPRPRGKLESALSEDQIDYAGQDENGGHLRGHMRDQELDKLEQEHMKYKEAIEKMKRK